MPGVKGQRWGERNYQSKDGTWTRLGLERRRAREGGGSSGKKESYFAKRKRIRVEKAEASKAKKAAAKEETAAKKAQKETETLEERRARILKSTNAKELFDNRDVLTTAEIRERMDRINVEASLNKMAESQKKTAIDRVDKMLMYGKKINEVYEFTQKPVCKALAKKMGLSKKPEPKPVNYEEALRNINRLSNDQVRDLAARTRNETTIRSYVNGLEDTQREATREALTRAINAGRNRRYRSR